MATAAISFPDPESTLLLNSVNCSFYNAAASCNFSYLASCTEFTLVLHTTYICPFSTSFLSSHITSLFLVNETARTRRMKRLKRTVSKFCSGLRPLEIPSLICPCRPLTPRVCSTPFQSKRIMKKKGYFAVPEV